MEIYDDSANGEKERKGKRRDAQRYYELESSCCSLELIFQ